MVRCPDCAREISDRADTCPGCGSPNLQRRSPAGQQALLVEAAFHGIMLMVGLCLLGWMIYSVFHRGD